MGDFRFKLSRFKITAPNCGVVFICSRKDKLERNRNVVITKRVSAKT